MGIVKIRGIVIRETKSGEADKFITVLAKDIGKINIFAKGAYNIKSKFLAGTSIFTYGDFIIRTASKTPTLNSVDIIESFYNITQDMSSYYCGMYLLEFANKAIGDVTDDNKYLLLLLKALMTISSSTNVNIMTVRIFELKMLMYLGYSPYNEKCVVCSREAPDNFTINGLLCSSCSKSLPSRQLSRSALYTLEYIAASDLNKLFKFKVSGDVFNELRFIAESYISYHLDCKLKTYEYIKDFTIDKSL